MELEWNWSSEVELHFVWVVDLVELQVELRIHTCVKWYTFYYAELYLELHSTPLLHNILPLPYMYPSVEGVTSSCIYITFTVVSLYI